MEIPYVVTPRKDTGLFNSKIAIWLFLASEVMLFGGLFSAYLFLRIYADYPWPERTLPIVPGLINTFILILSSITVVFAWASLKMRKWNQFRLYMLITLICAAVFMVLKVFEYKAKFEHQAVRLPDFTIVEGHLHKAEIDRDGHIHHNHGDQYAESKKDKKESYFKGYQNKIIFTTESLTLDLAQYYEGYLEELLDQAKKGGSKLTLAKDLQFQTSPGAEAVVLGKEGTPLTLEMLEEAKELFIQAKSSNAAARTEELRRQWRLAKRDNPDLENWRNAANVSIDTTLISDQLVKAPSSLSVNVEPALAFVLKPSSTSADQSSAKLKDGTLLKGTLQPSPMALGVDSVDFTFLVQKAEERGIDPDAAVEQSWVLENSPVLKSYWEKHKVHIAELEQELAGSGKEPTEKEKYRMTWKDILRYSSEGEIDLKWFNGFTGADHKKYTFPDLELPREQIAFESKFTPKWNNYYAIYFTITGLHGLHIIGGAIVLGYYMFCPNMFRTNPEWLANRVEVAGLFWHFVDLVWIFLFPILYLM